MKRSQRAANVRAFNREAERRKGWREHPDGIHVCMAQDCRLEAQYQQGYKKRLPTNERKTCAICGDEGYGYIFTPTTV